MLKRSSLKASSNSNASGDNDRYDDNGSDQQSLRSSRPQSVGLKFNEIGSPSHDREDTSLEPHSVREGSTR